MLNGGYGHKLPVFPIDCSISHIGDNLERITEFNLSEAAMSTVIGNNDTNKQWAMVGVVLYSKNYVQTNEVTDFCILQL